MVEVRIRDVGLTVLLRWEQSNQVFLQLVDQTKQPVNV